MDCCNKWACAKLFFRLLESDVTYIYVLQACGELREFGLGMSVLGLVVKSGFEHYLSVSNASLKALSAGINIHGHTIKIGINKDVFIGSSLIDLYCKCGNPDDGRLVFDLISEKNVVCWNSIVGGYSVNGRLEEAE